MGSTKSSAEVRAGLAHPVIDADGHVIEFLPAVRDHLRDEGGAGLVDRFDAVADAASGIEGPSADERRAMGLFRLTWWAYPARNTLDRATGMLPALLYERLDELGIDFAVLYPTLGLAALSIEEPELRLASIRAFTKSGVEGFARRTGQNERQYLEQFITIHERGLRRVTTAPIGCPLPMGFPKVTMSGTTSSCSNPHMWVPVRANPA